MSLTVTKTNLFYVTWTHPRIAGTDSSHTLFVQFRWPSMTTSGTDYFLHLLNYGRISSYKWSVAQTVTMSSWYSTNWFAIISYDHSIPAQLQVGTFVCHTYVYKGIIVIFMLMTSHAETDNL